MQTGTKPRPTRKSSERGGEDVEEEPQVYPEHHTRRAREQRGEKGVGGGVSGDRAQGSGVILCAAQCPTSLTDSLASHRQCGQRWPTCRRAQPRGPPRRRPRRRLRTCLALVFGEPGDGQGGRAGGYRATEGGRSRGGEGRGGGQGRTGGGGEGRGRSGRGRG